MTVAIIGAGRQGRSVARQACAAGHRVLLEDVLDSRLRQALEEIGPGVELCREVEDAVREADLVIDFVPDELESKLEIISMVDRMAPPHAILCVPTQVLDVDDLASCTYRAELFCTVRLDGTSPTVTPSAKAAAVLPVVQQFWSSLQ